MDGKSWYNVSIKLLFMSWNHYNSIVKILKPKLIEFMSLSKKIIIKYQEKRLLEQKQK